MVPVSKMSSRVSGWTSSETRNCSTSGLRPSASTQTSAAFPTAARASSRPVGTARDPSKMSAVTGTRRPRSADGDLRVVAGRRARELHRLQQLAPVLLHVAVEERSRLVELVEQPLPLALHLLLPQDGIGQAGEDRPV